MNMSCRACALTAQARQRQAEVNVQTVQRRTAVWPALHAAGRGSFRHAAILHHGSVEPVAAGEISAVITVSGQDPAGNVAAQSALAHHIDCFSLFDLSQTFPQFIHRDIYKSLNMSVLEFSRGTGIQQGDASVTGQVCHILRMELLYHAFFDILDHKSRHIDRILG